jgi:hypothetical protein
MKIWIVYALKNGKKMQGPYSEEEIKIALQTGQFDYDDLVWQPHWQKWKLVRECKEFVPKPCLDIAIEKNTSDSYKVNKANIIKLL